LYELIAGVVIVGVIAAILLYCYSSGSSKNRGRRRGRDNAYDHTYAHAHRVPQLPTRKKKPKNPYD